MDDEEDLLYCQQGQHQGVRRRSCQKQKSGRSSLPQSLPPPRCQDSEAGKKDSFKSAVVSVSLQKAMCGGHWKKSMKRTSCQQCF